MRSFPEQLADRYRRFRFRHFAEPAPLRGAGGAGQTPDVMVVSCCDSRVDPETIFSAMPGELFVVRNVANLVPPFETTGKFHGVSAALEFAALNLRVATSSSSATPAAAASAPASSSETPPARPRRSSSPTGCRCSTTRAAGCWPRPGGSPTVDVRARARRRQDVAREPAHFPVHPTLEGKGRVALHGAHFDIATGTLSVLNHSRNEFFPI